MKMNKLDGLRDKLNENKLWPLRYMFKFIVPNKDGKVDLLTGLLPTEGDISYKHTKNLKYVSVTCISHMQSPDDIIYIMQQALNIEGVMSL